MPRPVPSSSRRKFAVREHTKNAVSDLGLQVRIRAAALSSHLHQPATHLDTARASWYTAHTVAELLSRTSQATRPDQSSEC